MEKGKLWGFPFLLLILLEGRLRYRSNNDKDGVTKYVMEIGGDQLILLDRKVPEGTGFRDLVSDTDLLISMSKKYFDITESSLKDEVTNEKWVCKKCGSSYEFGWSDFSIYVERQKLKLTDLKADLIGLSTTKPIPLYLGLAGHSYPSKEEIASVPFDEFKKYMTEQ